MIRFLHAADVHLDSPLEGLERYDDGLAESARGATRKALVKLVDYALEAKVDFVLIAGDLYDGDWKDYNTGLFFVRQAARLRDAGIPLFMIAGNHDAQSHMTRSLRVENADGLPAMFASREPERRVLEDLGVAVHGQSFSQREVKSNLARDYLPAVPGMVNVAMLHTGLEGEEGHATYAPCTVADLAAKDFDYWALGHIHASRIVSKSPRVVFAGNVQGRHVRETGAKGAYLVEIDPHRRTVSETFVPLDVFRWTVCDVDVSGLAAFDAVVDRAVEEASAASLRQGGLPTAVRVRIVGATPLYDRLLADSSRLTNELRAGLVGGGGQVWLEKVKLEAVPPRREADERLDGPWTEFEAVLAAAQNDPALLKEMRELLRPLDQMLPEELRGGADGFRLQDDDWLRSLVGQAPHFLRAKLAAGPPG